ncbi:MAG TPA: hypothetical protein VG056_13600 [Pirellulales bacterium]|nr:hypothetical protein [Pirellulales bacterium]
MIAPQDVPPRFDGDTRFCALEEREAQCLAAKNAPIANLLVHEADAAAAQPQGLCGHKGSSELTSEVLRLEAVYKRNIAAADALEAFLRLLEAEAGADNLEQRGREMNLVLADIGRLQERGIMSPISKPESEGQRLDLWHRQAELGATVNTLNFQLKNLLGVETVGDSRIWPQASLAVTADIPDRQQALNVALANRADLAAVRLVAYSNGDDSDAAARTILQLSGGGMGAAPPPTGCLTLLIHHGAAADERAARSAQMAELLADRERAARDETLQAVAILETRIAQIAISRQRLAVAQAHLQASEQQQQLTAGAPLGVRKARLDVLAIEQDLLHDAIEWKLAVVKLKEAQGLLAVECGYDAASRTMSRTNCCP